MARFYASIQGNRGEATRWGTPASGIESHARGRNTGARVDCMAVSGSLVSEGGAGDRVDVIRTGGTNGRRPMEPDSVSWVDDGPAFFRINGVESGEARKLAERIGSALSASESIDSGEAITMLRAAAFMLDRLAPNPDRR